MWGPTKNLGRIVSAVLTFIGYKQTNKQTDKPNLYIDCKHLNNSLGKDSQLYPWNLYMIDSVEDIVVFLGFKVLISIIPNCKSINFAEKPQFENNHL